MVTTKRSKDNPLFYPNKINSWESEAAFNGSILKENGSYNMLYRALSLEHLHEDVRMKLSTIGICSSGDGVHFRKRRQLIIPEQPWEKYGVEDPRITKLENNYYIFYTALSAWPPNADSIKVGVAISDNLVKIEEKHPVTPFNAKAFVLFPEKINGKLTALLTVNTDNPPSRIAWAQFEEVNQIWDELYWKKWYEKIGDHEISISKSDNDHLEIGAVPVKTDEGWILVLSYIQDYFSENRIFRIDAALLDLDDPRKVTGQTLDPLLVPEEHYEVYGMVPNVIFPTSALIEEGQFFIYYSACDTSICRASITLNDLLLELKHNPTVNPHRKKSEILVRFEKNPIISPAENHDWESKYTFNAGAILVENEVHILYRAMGNDDTSVLGYALTKDGFNIEKRPDTPVYQPREQFEMKTHAGFSGCEDPRLTLIEETIYMCYTAYDGSNPPRVALTSISKKDFVKNIWEWQRPRLISAPGMDNKDSCIVSEKISGKYLIFHRLPPCIWVDVVSDLEFDDNHYLGGHPLMSPRVNSWDNLKIGLNGPPEKTEDGWLLLYHGVSKEDMKYRMGAALLDLNSPLKVLARLHNPILEPLAWYENEGYRTGTVFSCGQVIKDDTLYVYYGGADKYLAVATCSLTEILDALKKGK